MKKTAITLGDPNSISPEIVIKALNKLDLPADDFLIIGSKSIFDFYRDNYNLKLNKPHNIIDIGYKFSDIEISKQTAAAGDFSFRALKAVCELAKNRDINAIVTAPVSKYSMNLAGHHFSGQTEILEKFLSHDGQKAEMLFVSDLIKVFLLTRHLPLNNVSSQITTDLIIKKAKVLNENLINKFYIKNPKLALCALNPHAGENGLLGKEEESTYKPAVSLLKNSGINIDGPFPADTLFSQADKYDCYIASYHDQGLIPVKLLGLKSVVNTTIGLDILRTSPAHGTAFDIAGQNKADESSMISAIKLAMNF